MRTDLIETLKLVGLENDAFNTVDDDDIKILEGKLNLTLPEDYKHFLKEYTPSFFRGDARYRLLETSPWSKKGEQSIDIFYGFSDDSDFDILSENLSRENDFPGTFSIGYDSGSNDLLLQCPDGQVLFHDRDSNKTFLVAHTFTAFLDSFFINEEE